MANKAKAVKVTHEAAAHQSAAPRHAAVKPVSVPHPPKKTDGVRRAPVNSSVRRSGQNRPSTPPPPPQNAAQKPTETGIVFTDERSIAATQPVDYLPPTEPKPEQPAPQTQEAPAGTEKTSTAKRSKPTKKAPADTDESAPIALPPPVHNVSDAATSPAAKMPDKAIGADGVRPCSSYFDAPENNGCTYALKRGEVATDDTEKPASDKDERKRKRHEEMERRLAEHENRKAETSLQEKKKRTAEELREAERKTGGKKHAKAKPDGAGNGMSPDAAAPSAGKNAKSKNDVSHSVPADKSNVTTGSAGDSVKKDTQSKASKDAKKLDVADRKSARFALFKKKAIPEAGSAIPLDGSAAAPADTSLQGWRKLSVPRRIIMLLSVALLIFSLSPLYVGIVSPGMLPPICIAGFCFTVAWLWNKIAAQKKWYINLLYALVALCVCAGVVMMSSISGKMISASLHTPPTDSDEVTVVVLGCLIKGDQPSLMLKDRLDTAAVYLAEHPGAYCVVTGGQGEDEEYPESVVMRRYLADQGISDRRIVAETTSTSTEENINNAAAMVKGCKLYNKAVIVSDRFHQFRARRLAQEAGFDYVYALNVETRWYLAMPYWFREMACIVRDWLIEQVA